MVLQNTRPERFTSSSAHAYVGISSWGHGYAVIKSVRRKSWWNPTRSVWVAFIAWWHAWHETKWLESWMTSASMAWIFKGGTRLTIRQLPTVTELLAEGSSFPFFLRRPGRLAETQRCEHPKSSELLEWTSTIINHHHSTTIINSIIIIQSSTIIIQQRSFNNYHQLRINYHRPKFGQKKHNSRFPTTLTRPHMTSDTRPCAMQVPRTC